jgi:mannose-6-phosphate isomerase-like protein (cupin superfamily)
VPTIICPVFCTGIEKMKNRIHDNPVLGNRIEFKEICEETSGKRTVAEVTLRPFDGIPLHYHNEFSEYYEVLEGELHIQVEKEIKVLTKGDYVLVPVRALHRYFNKTSEPVIFKVVIQPGNIGYQLLISVLNGLARDGKVTKKGLPRNWLIFGYLSVAAGSNVPGLMTFLQPLLNWLYKLAIKKGIDKKLLAKYYL